MSNSICYLLNNATESELYSHLSACDVDFVRALTKRVNIAEYCAKIYNKAVRFEAWAGDTLVGLVAAYCNDQTKCLVYITSVSVLSEWQEKGIAAQLIGHCIEHAEVLGMHCISLEVARGNAPAIRLYEKLGFVKTCAGDSFLTMNLFFTR